MEFLKKAAGIPVSVAAFPGSFNPPTVAHVELASAAARLVDEVVLVLPSRLPHKGYEGVSLEDRARLLVAVAADEPRFSVAISDGGLFVEIARECRGAYREVGIAAVCGRDAAERMVAWPSDESVESMLSDFELIVAARAGKWQPPPEIAHRVRLLECEDLPDVSGTRIRSLIAAGERWEHLVPRGIIADVRRLYSRNNGVYS